MGDPLTLVKGRGKSSSLVYGWNSSVDKNEWQLYYSVTPGSPAKTAVRKNLPISKFGRYMQLPTLYRKRSPMLKYIQTMAIGEWAGWPIRCQNVERLEDQE